MMRPEPLLTVLDEPTSALDPDAEALILGTYVVAARSASARAGGVSVIVTHRMSTARLADRILFLENGRIVEDGDHDTLVARGGRYAELFDVQARGYR
jgi:ATP-binding cassette subfamily B protein